MVMYLACHVAHLSVLFAAEKLHSGLHSDCDGHARKKQQLQWQHSTGSRQGHVKKRKLGSGKGGTETATQQARAWTS
jgi:hypothetical protein